MMMVISLRTDTASSVTTSREVHIVRQLTSMECISDVEYDGRTINQ